METTIRKMILESAYYAKHGHMPSALCIVEIMCAYDKIRTSNDEFILSKGHGCLAYYAYLVEKGLLQFEELKSFGKKGSRLGGHPDKNKVPEVYASTGSLGQGFPMAVGAALARKINGKPGKIFCLVGDGECNEGTIWESLQMAVKLDLDNIEYAAKCGIDRIELYTGPYAEEFKLNPKKAIERYHSAAKFACEIGLEINAGHDLDLTNLSYFKENIAGLKEVSIGHALISDALYLGLENTIQLYKKELI